jgi:[CysO sulfur-carrier protein]-S-L-cysteine hydrolase
VLQAPLNQEEEAAAGVKTDKLRNIVYIEKSVLNSMIEHCKQEAPYEACGLLSGTHGKNKTLWKMRNVEKSGTSFAMDINQIAATIKLMSRNLETMTGIYHSHPTAAPYPSKNDIIHAHYPDVAYFIVSLAYGKPSVKCYRIKSKQVSPLNIVEL